METDEKKTSSGRQTVTSIENELKRASPLFLLSVIVNLAISHPPAKRSRADHDKDEYPLLPECTRSAPWFEDGNIVLEAEKVQFKVYKGILAANSAIFRDMFAIAQAQGEEIVDGCPLVHLGDKSQDLAHVLEALHDSSKWLDDSFEKRKSMPLAVAEGFLRLGRKYEIDHIRNQAVQRLAVIFPSDFKKFREAFSQITQPIVINTHDSLSVVNILRGNDLLVHLPMALLMCIILDHVNLLSFFPLSPATQQPILPYTDLNLCHKAHLILLSRTMDVFSWLQPLEALSTCNDRICKSQREATHQEWFGTPPFSIPMDLILADWEDEWAERLCEQCRANARQKTTEGQEKLFAILPSM